MKLLNMWTDEVWMPRNFLSLSAESGSEGGDEGGGGGGDEGDEAPQRPEFVPEKFWDGEKGEVRLQSAFESYGHLERKLGQQSDEMRATITAELEQQRLAGRPETPEGYQVSLPDSYTEMGITITDDDPLVSFWRDQAHDFGLSNEAFNAALKNYVDHAIKNGPDPQVELAKLGDTGKVRVEQLGRWAERNFRDEELAAIQGMTTTAAGVTALERLVQMAQGDQGPPRDFGDTAPARQLTDADLQSMMDDPRYWDPIKRDPAYVKRIELGFEKLYQTKRA